MGWDVGVGRWVGLVTGVVLTGSGPLKTHPPELQLLLFCSLAVRPGFSG